MDAELLTVIIDPLLLTSVIANARFACCMRPCDAALPGLWKPADEIISNEELSSIAPPNAVSSWRNVDAWQPELIATVRF
jgi:hypothetical protein